MNQTIHPSNVSGKYTINRSILIVGSHADDIEIYCGGTALKYRDRGYDIVYVQATNNMSGQVSELDENGKRIVVAKNEGPVPMMKRRKAECDAAAAVLGTTPIHLDHPQRHYNGPDGRQIELRYGCDLPEGVPADAPTILTACEDKASIQRLADLILEKDPECVFCCGIADPNPEHFATALLTVNAYWKAVEAGFKGAMLQWRSFFGLFGEANCRWETFIDYSPYLERKMELIHKHYCQMPNARQPDFGHLRLARWWGSACGCAAAEVFTWVNRTAHRDAGGPIHADLTLELIQNSR